MIFKRVFSKDLVVLLIVSTIFLVGWTFAVPMYESPDEQTHWQVAEYIHDHHKLPLYTPAMIEGNQAPLYYLLIAPLASRTAEPKIELTFHDRQPVLKCFPRIWKICATDLGRFWPMRWARIMTALISVIGVLFIYLGALEVSGKRSIAFLAGCFTAFLPNFAFRGGNISNDALLTTTSAIATYYLIDLLRTGFSWRKGLITSLLIGISFLSKVNAAILFAGLVLVLLMLKAPWPQRLIRLSVLLAGGSLILPWVIRNELLYGDPMATTKAMLTAVSDQIAIKSITSSYFVTTFPYLLFRTGVGTFGAILNIALPSYVYVAYIIVFSIGLLGVLYLLAFRRTERRVILLLLTLCLLALLSVIQLNLTITQPQGRYLYAGLPSFMILLAVGCAKFFGNRVASTMVLAMLACSTGVYALFAVELPAYRDSGTGKPQTEGAVAVLSPSEATIAGPLLPGDTFGQTFEPTQDGLDEIDITVGTWWKRIKGGVLTLHLREYMASKDIVTRDVPASQIEDNQFLSLKFPPIAGSENKAYYFFVEQHGIPETTPVTLWISKGNMYAGGKFYRNNQPMDVDMQFRTFSSGAQACSACE